MGLLGENGVMNGR